MDKICRGCGAKITGLAENNRRQFCEECRKVKVKEHNAERYARKPGMEKREAKKHSIDDVVKLAKDWGLSYGMAVRRLHD